MKIIPTHRLRIVNQLFTYAIIIASIFSGCAKKDPESVSKATLKSNEATQKLLSVDLMSGNPILPVATADPDIIYANGKYYIYPTATGPNASQFHAYSSTDLLNWTDEGIVLDLVNVSWAHTDGWAPSVVARNGNYYFYYTAAKKIGVAVSSSPTGPFVDKGSALATGDGTDPIDPMVFVDTDGQAYMYWGNTTKTFSGLIMI